MDWISPGSGYPGGYLLVVGEIKVDNEMLVMRLTSRLELIVVRSCSELRSIMGGASPSENSNPQLGRRYSVTWLPVPCNYRIQGMVSFVEPTHALTSFCPN